MPYSIHYIQSAINFNILVVNESKVKKEVTGPSIKMQNEFVTPTDTIEIYDNTNQKIDG